MADTQRMKSEDLDRRRAEAESHLLQVGGIYISALTAISVWLLKSPGDFSSQTDNPLLGPTLLFLLLMFNTLILFVIGYYATQVGALEHLMCVQQSAKLQDQGFASGDQAWSGSAVSWSSLYGASRTLRFLDEAAIGMLLLCVLLVTAVLSYCMFISAGKARWLMAVPLALQLTCISLAVRFSFRGRGKLAKELLGCEEFEHGIMCSRDLAEDEPNQGP